MPAKSSRPYSAWTDYLPPVVTGEELPGEDFLPKFLHIFERLLTGVPAEIGDPKAGENVSPPLNETIDSLHRVLNPWTTPPKLLPEIARWVNLRIEDDWSEYELRRRIEQSVRGYQLRWLKKGFFNVLQTLNADQVRPRIVIDDGEAVLKATCKANGRMELHAIAHAHPFSHSDRWHGALLHPIDIDTEELPSGGRALLVLDSGKKKESSPRGEHPTLWRISSTGEFLDWVPRGGDGSAAAIPVPVPVNFNDSADLLMFPVTVRVESPGRYLVLDGRNSAAPSDTRLYRYERSVDGLGIPSYSRTTALGNFPAVEPISFEAEDNGRFVLLDQGNETAAFPVALRVLHHDSGTSTTVTEQTIDLSAMVVRPTAMLRLGPGHYLITDARRDSLPDGTSPGNFSDAVLKLLVGDVVEVQVDLSGASAPVISSRLGAVAPRQNPLVYPTGIIVEDPAEPNVVLVCDRGAKLSPFGGNVSVMALAEHPNVYRIDLRETTPTIVPLVSERRLVSPSALVREEAGDVLIVDEGAFSNFPTRFADWRAEFLEFGVELLFSGDRPPQAEDRERMDREIRRLLESEKPAASRLHLDF